MITLNSLDSEVVTWSEELVESIRALMEDDFMRAAFTCLKTKPEHWGNLNFNIEYFVDHLDRILDKDYVPIDHDVLRLPKFISPNGLTQISYLCRGQLIEVLNAGDLKHSSFQKWIDQFDNVGTLVFLHSLMTLEREAMEEVWNYWDVVCHNRFLRRANIVVMFTHNDIFKDIYAQIDIKSFFPNFTGDNTDPTSFHSYLRAEFVNKNLERNRQIFLHIGANPTVPENVEVIWRSLVADTTMVLL
jgi:hypothetical protein